MNYDYIIIGAGISGAAAGYELALHGKVAIVEAESTAGYHSTGRSAALFTPNYGPELVRRICRLGLPFMSRPPQEFTRQALLAPRGMLTVFPDGAEDAMRELLATGGAGFTGITARQTLDKVPFLLADHVGGAVYEAAVQDMDVNALYQGFLSGFKQRGGTLLTSSRIEAISKLSSGWEFFASNTVYHARVIINAAGAWADEIATMANVPLIGLQPKRRTAILIDPPDGVNLSAIPAMDFHGVTNYIKPETSQLMVSPGDETLVIPQDIQPDDMDIAELVDWLERKTAIPVSRPKHRWAGLRNFVADGLPVVGFDESTEDFFWLAAQGGYGIMMAGPLARASASLLTINQLPQDFIDAGINKKDLSAHRMANIG